MSKALRIVGTIASIAAVVTGNPIFAAVAVVANVGAELTQKKPPARGSTSNVLIGANQPIPYTMGRTYVGGIQVHDVGYGGEVSDVKNPYRSMALVWSGAGPVDSIESFQADFAAISFSGGNAVGYYNNFLYLDTQLGATPEGSALAGPFGAIPQWGAAYKMSGYCAGLITAKFDKKAKRYASGLPQFGAIIKGVMAYDPRLDTTYPGGSGAHRFDDETTWEWSENPGLHGIAYARGRYHNGKKVFGCGFRETGIDLAAWVAFANVCDANGWTLGGTIYEPGSRWDNLKRICAAGAAEPCFVGGLLSVKYQAPRVAVDTITAVDLADGEPSIPAMKTWRDRINGIVPKYRSEAHKWEYVQSDLVSVSAYVTEDRGEEKNQERQIDLIQDKDQAAQVCTYELVNARELGPIVLPCKPRLINYKVGEAIEVDIPEAGLNSQLCLIIGRKFDPASAIVELTLESETTAKHAFALGQTGTAPPTPAITDGEDLDDIVTDNAPASTTHVVADEAAMLALTALEGDIAVRTDITSTFIHNGGATGTVTDWTELPSPLGPTDGDKGDIIVALSGTSYTIDSNVVSFAKMADLATDRLIGRDTAGTGDPEALTVGGGIEFTGAGGIQTSAFTGDATKTAGGTALTLATVNPNVGSFGSATQSLTVIVNGKGLVTGISAQTVTPAVGSITGLGTGIATALAVNVGSAGAPVLFNGAGGTPTSLTLTNATGLVTAGLVNDAVTYAKIQNVSATDKVLGRSTVGAGDIEEITFTASARAIAALNIVQGDLIYGTGAGTVTVLAKSASATRYLANTGTSNAPAWAQIDLSNGVTGDLPFANIAQIATAKVLGRLTAGTGDIEELPTTGTVNVVLSASPTFTGTAAFAALTTSGNAGITGQVNSGNGLRVTSFSATGWAGAGLDIVFTGGEGYVNTINRTSATFLPLNIQASVYRMLVAGLGNYANDAAAAVGGVAVGTLYRNGSALMIRVA